MTSTLQLEQFDGAGSSGRWVYHCFRWQGPCSLMRDPDAQHDPRIAVPPAHAQGWTAKPGTLHVNSHMEVGPALDWLWHQMRHTTKTTAESHPAWPTTDIAADFNELRAELLGPAATCEWMYRLPDGAAFLAAIVGIHHRTPSTEDSHHRGNTARLPPDDRRKTTMRRPRYLRKLQRTVRAFQSAHKKLDRAHGEIYKALNTGSTRHAIETQLALTCASGSLTNAQRTSEILRDHLEIAEDQVAEAAKARSKVE